MRLFFILLTLFTTIIIFFNIMRSIMFDYLFCRRRKEAVKKRYFVLEIGSSSESHDHLCSFAFQKLFFALLVSRSSSFCPATLFYLLTNTFWGWPAICNWFSSFSFKEASLRCLFWKNHKIYLIRLLILCI